MGLGSWRESVGDNSDARLFILSARSSASAWRVQLVAFRADARRHKRRAHGVAGHASEHHGRPCSEAHVFFTAVSTRVHDAHTLCASCLATAFHNFHSHAGDGQNTHAMASRAIQQRGAVQCAARQPPQRAPTTIAPRTIIPAVRTAVRDVLATHRGFFGTCPRPHVLRRQSLRRQSFLP